MMSDRFDSLQAPVHVKVPLPEHGAGLVLEVEREILDFFSRLPGEGLRITFSEVQETPSEWFLTTITAFARDAVAQSIDDGDDVRTALAHAVEETCSYAAPAYYVGRALQLVVAGAGRPELRAQVVVYLRNHPVQRRRLSDPSHRDSVPEIAEELRAVLAESERA